jgi:hypothetical protein
MIVLEPLVSLGLGLIAGNIVSTTGEVFGAMTRCAIQWQRQGTSDSPSQAPVGIARGSRPVLMQRPRGRIRHRSPAVNMLVGDPGCVRDPARLRLSPKGPAADPTCACRLDGTDAPVDLAVLA